MSVSRIESRCPNCRSNDVELRSIGGVSWLHCNICWENWDPLDVNLVRRLPMIEGGDPAQLEQKI